MRSRILRASPVLLFSLSLLAAAALSSLVPPVAAAASAVIQNDSMWVDTLGQVRIVGEVKNTGDLWLRFVKITGTLYDGAGVVVDVVLKGELIQVLVSSCPSQHYQRLNLLLDCAL